MKTWLLLFAFLLSPPGQASSLRKAEADQLLSSDHTKTWSLPSAADTLAGLAASQTLTNKTMSGASNTFSNLQFTSFASGAVSTPAQQSAARTINAQSGTTYTFVLADGANAGGFPLVTGTNASTQTYTVPPNSSVAYPVGDQIDVCQLGAGKITFAPGSGVTISSNGSNLSINGQYVCVTLVKTATNTWILFGNLTT